MDTGRCKCKENVEGFNCDRYATHMHTRTHTRQSMSAEGIEHIAFSTVETSLFYGHKKELLGYITVPHPPPPNPNPPPG